MRLPLWRSRKLLSKTRDRKNGRHDGEDAPDSTRSRRNAPFTHEPEYSGILCKRPFEPERPEAPPPRTR